MTHIPVMLVFCRPRFTTAFDIKSSNLFVPPQIVDLSSREKYESQLRNGKTEVLRFARRAREKWPIGVLWRIASAISAFGLNPIRAKEPRVVVFIEGVWPDACGDDKLQPILKEILESKEWREKAVPDGAMACLYSSNADSHGRSNHRAAELVNIGIDFFIDPADFCGNTLKESEKKLEWLIRRRYELLTRQRNGAVYSVRAGICIAALCLGCAGFIQGAMSQLVITVSQCVSQHAIAAIISASAVTAVIAIRFLSRKTADKNGQ